MGERAFQARNAFLAEPRVSKRRGIWCGAHSNSLRPSSALAGKVIADGWFAATVLPQLHVLAWGNKRGVRGWVETAVAQLRTF
jgi:hypothetical protein